MQGRGSDMAVRKRIWTTTKGEEKTAWKVDYADINGVRRQKTFRLKKNADAYEARVKIEVSEGVHVADRATITVGEAGDNWIKSCKASGLERTTTDQYENHLELHLKPFVGRTLLSKLSVPGVRALQDQLRDEGRSPTMVKRVTVSLGSILADAQERGLVARNVVREIAQRRGKNRASAVEKRQKARLRAGVDIPTPAEVGRIIQKAEGRYRPFLLTAIFAGLRSSELRGLRWDDIDLKRSLLHVRQRADRYQEMGMPKSDAGQRTIPLPPIVVNTLRE